MGGAEAGGAPADAPPEPFHYCHVPAPSVAALTTAPGAPLPPPPPAPGCTACQQAYYTATAAASTDPDRWAALRAADAARLTAALAAGTAPPGGAPPPAKQRKTAMAALVEALTYVPRAVGVDADLARAVAAYAAGADARLAAHPRSGGRGLGACLGAGGHMAGLYVAAASRHADTWRVARAALDAALAARGPLAPGDDALAAAGVVADALQLVDAALAPGAPPRRACRGGAARSRRRARARCARRATPCAR